MRTRLIALPALSIAALLAGCSGDSESAGTSAASKPDSPSSAATASDKASSDPTSAAANRTHAAESSGSTPEDGAPTTGSRSAASPAPEGSGSTVTKKGLVSMADKLGCVDREVVTPPSDAPGSPVAETTIVCLAGNDGPHQYTLFLVDSPKHKDGVADAAGAVPGDLNYLHGPNWLVFGSDTDDAGSSSFTRKAAEHAQRTLGEGTIATG